MEGEKWEGNDQKRETDTGGTKVGIVNVTSPNPLEGSYQAGPGSLSLSSQHRAFFTQPCHTKQAALLAQLAKGSQCWFTGDWAPIICRTGMAAEPPNQLTKGILICPGLLLPSEPATQKDKDAKELTHSNPSCLSLPRSSPESSGLSANSALSNTSLTITHRGVMVHSTRYGVSRPESGPRLTESKSVCKFAVEWCPKQPPKKNEHNAVDMSQQCMKLRTFPHPFHLF